jgi:hypothetical protein
MKQKLESLTVNPRELETKERLNIAQPGNLSEWWSQAELCVAR